MPVVFIVLVNGGYCLLKSFAKLEDASGVPGLDIMKLDMVSLWRRHGCKTLHATTRAEVAEAFRTALQRKKTHCAVNHEIA